MTEDFCDGTRIRVVTGIVQVWDLVLEEVRPRPAGRELLRGGEEEVAPGRRYAERGEHIVCVCVGLDPAHDRLATFPSASMTNVDRSMPMYALPAMDFSAQTPYVSATACSGSARSVNGNPYLSRNFACDDDGVGADTEHDGAARLELAPGVADFARLQRAAGRVVLWIEVEHDGLAAERGQPNAFAGVAFELEVRSRAAFGHCHSRIVSRYDFAV